MMKRAYIILALVTAVVIMGVLFFLDGKRYGTLEISAPEKTPDSRVVAVKILREGAEAQSLTLKPGETRSLRLKTGALRVDGSVGNLKAVDIVTIRNGKPAKLKTPVGEDLPIRQLGSEATYCPVISGGKVFSHNCRGDGPVVKHITNDIGGSDNASAFGGQNFSSMQPYKDGLIGVQKISDESTEIQYLDFGSETIQSVQLSSDLQKLLQQDWPQLITSAEAGSSRLALLFSSSNRMYLLDDITDTTPVRIQPGKGLRINELGRLVTASFSGDRLTLFMGEATHSDDGPTEGLTEIPVETNKTRKELPKYVFEYDTSGKLTRTIRLTADTVIQNIQRLTGNYYVGEDEASVRFYYLNDGEMQLIYDVPEVASKVVLNDAVYVQAGGTLYLFEPGQDGSFGLHSVFTSSKIRVSEVFSTSDGIVFTAYAGKGTEAPLNIYQLLARGQSSHTEPVYTGFGDLLIYGLSSKQLAGLKYTLGAYVKTTDPSADEVTISKVEPFPHDRFSTSMFDSMYFMVETNSKKTFRAKIDYFGITSIRLFLYNPKTFTLVYDSQTVTRP